jgi:hypothetical protein
MLEPLSCCVCQVRPSPYDAHTFQCESRWLRLECHFAVHEESIEFRGVMPQEHLQFLDFGFTRCGAQRSGGGHHPLKVSQSGGRALKSFMCHLIGCNRCCGMEGQSQLLGSVAQVLKHCVSRSWVSDDRFHVCDQVSSRCVIKVSLRCKVLREGFSFEARTLRFRGTQGKLRAALQGE